MGAIKGGFGAGLLGCLTLVGGSQAQAAASGRHHWSDHALRLSLTYPAGWSPVSEHGAVLKLRAADGKGEFEIFRTPRMSTPAALVAGAARALAQARCQVKETHGSRSIGRLGVRGSVVMGACTGADQGWRLTVTAFTYGGNGLLLRSWLYQAPAGDSTDLPEIEESLSPAGG
ncbi:MAG TPA: hypothetical protein VN837_21645 [Chloroflexota bacterium]|nr:hypothetical protein [Chloroflexota bacterium]